MSGYVADLSSHTLADEPNKLQRAKTSATNQTLLTGPVGGLRALEQPWGASSCLGEATVPPPSGQDAANASFCREVARARRWSRSRHGWEMELLLDRCE